MSLWSLSRSFLCIAPHGCSHDDRPTDFRAHGTESNTTSAEQSRCTITNVHRTCCTTLPPHHINQLPVTNRGRATEECDMETWRRAKITKRNVTGEAGAQRRSGFSRAFQQCSARRDMSIEMVADHLSVTPAEPQNSSAIYVARTCENNVKHVPTKNHHQTWDPNDGEWRAPRNRATQFSCVPTLVIRTHLNAVK